MDLNKLKTIPKANRIVYAYLICERLFPNYCAFNTKYGFGNPKELRETLDFIYQNIFNDLILEHEIIQRVELIEENIPRPENYESILASSALDACMAIQETLLFMSDLRLERLSDISSFAIDSIDMYIQERDDLDFNTDPEFNEKIIKDPLYVKELKTQMEAISSLSGISKLDYLLVDVLLKKQYNNGKGNLNL